LLTYDWPGNVRELRNVMERASILVAPDSALLPTHLPSLRVGTDFSLSHSPVAKTEEQAFTPTTLDEVERQHLEATLRFHQWNLQATARDLGISRDTLYRKIEKYNLSPEP